VFVQMTRTIPFRRTILQFSQIRLTLLRTFMIEILSFRRTPTGNRVSYRILCLATSSVNRKRWSPTRARELPEAAKPTDGHPLAFFRNP
jgi:hypothetical protein